VKNVARGLLILMLLLLVACPQNPPIPPSGFNIELRFLPGFPTEYKVFVQGKANFWEKVITGDIANIPGISDSTGCNFTSEQVPTPLILPPVTDVDDIILYVGLLPTIADPNYPRHAISDGLGGTAAIADWCLIRSQGNNINLPIISKIEFDSIDLPNLSTPSQQLSTLADITLHEMGHAFGFGTIWNQFPGLMITTPDGTSCGDNPQFTGLNAKREYEILGGTGNVPLAASKERGTCGHWAEGMFRDEILTPGINPDELNLLSRLTIASMADLGYTVSYNNADDYQLSLPEASTDFRIEFVFDKNIPVAYRKYFFAARDRWQKVITGDIPDMQGFFNPLDGDCNIDHQSKFSGIDDIKIFVDIVSTNQSDGFGGFRSRIEPCLTRVGSFLPAISIMQYDISDFSSILPLLQNPNPSAADIAASDTTLELTREMGRVLGFGTNWVKKSLITGLLGNGLCAQDQEYIGSNAVREYNLLSNIPYPFILRYYTLGSIGTDCIDYWAHRFEYDLMGLNRKKPIPNTNNTIPPALSKITIGAMQDLGYTVDYSVADPYALDLVGGCEILGGCSN
jgi:hypothetical protein